MEATPDLKDSLRGYLKGATSGIKRKLAEHEKARRVLGRADFKDARYRVELQSLWEDHGEKSIQFNYHGSIDEAIKKAEHDYKETNKRSDIQAKYSVAILLGDMYVPIPETFWRQYKSRSNLPSRQRV